MCSMQHDDFSLHDLRDAAKKRWLTTEEYDYLLGVGTSPLLLSIQPPIEPPPPGTLLLFDRNRTLYYKCDGYEWVKRKKRKSKVREDHTKLRINGKPRLGGVYARSLTIPSLHRRGYYQLDPETGETRYPFKHPTTKVQNISSNHVPSLILMHYLIVDDDDMKRENSPLGEKRREPGVLDMKTCDVTAKAGREIMKDACSSLSDSKMQEFERERNVRMKMDLDRPTQDTFTSSEDICNLMKPNTAKELACFQNSASNNMRRAHLPIDNGASLLHMNGTNGSLSIQMCSTRGLLFTRLDKLWIQFMAL